MPNSKFIHSHTRDIIMKIIEKIAKILLLITALTSIVTVVLICVFLFANGVPAIGEIGFSSFIFGKDWSPNDIPASYGIFNMILGSIYITIGAVIIGVPIGILTAVFLSRFCPKPLYKFIKPAIELLAGIPSIVYGFFGLTVVVPFVRDYFGGTGNSIISASVILGIMILPTIIGVSESAISAVPDSYFEGALALGATKERSVFKAVLPAAKSGVFAGVVLGIGRAIGETMAVVLIAGNQVQTPDSFTDGIRTLTANIVLEMGYATGLHREALIATGCVLFVFILLINLIFSIFRNRGAKNG